MKGRGVYIGVKGVKELFDSIIRYPIFDIRYSICFLLFTFFFLLSPFCNSLYAQTDTKGTDFWLAFGCNGGMPYSSVDMQMRIVGGDEDATVTIYYTDVDSAISFSVSAHSVYTGNERRVLGDKLKKASYNITAGKSRRSIHITATAPITVYAINQLKNSTDATNVLPITALGTNYYHISYTILNNEKYLDAYAVIATQNGTQIRHNNEPPITLDMGEVYYRTHTADMTGAHITADKPIAYFALNQGVQIPTGKAAVDHLFQQLAPVNTWGKNFFVPVSYKRRDRVRIMVSQNGTNITLSGGVIQNVTGGQTTLTGLSAGQWVELEVLLADKGCFIQTNKPVGVCAYLTGGHYNEPDIDISDPAQAWLPPIEQTVTSALIAPFIPAGNSALSKHYALIIAPWANRDETKVKKGTETEVALSGGQWYQSPTGGMAFYDFPLTSEKESYIFTNKEGIIVMGYGTGTAESYYYMASSSMRTLDVAFYVNDIFYQELAAEFFCTQPTKFRAKIEGDMSVNPGHLLWYIDDVPQPTATDALTWTKTLPDGVYRIKIEALMEDNVTRRIEEADITIAKPELEPPQDVILCPDEISSPVSCTGKWMNETLSTWELVSGDGTRIGLPTNSGTLPIPAFKAVNSGDSPDSVKIKVTPIAANGCTGEPKTFTIIVKNKAKISVDLGKHKMICRFDSLTLNATHPLADSYLWQDSSTNPTYTAYQTGQFWVIVSGQCNKVSDTVQITYYKDLTASLGQDLLFCEDDMIYRELKVNVNMSDVSYQWQDSSTASTYIVTQPGTYSVTVSNICMSVSDAIEVILKDCRVLELWIPNAFTPDGDGINDIFKPEINNLEYLKEYEMVIYNRWGGLIFITHEYLTGWDGKFKGKDCSAGIYTAMIKYKDNENKEFVKVSTIMLVR